MVYLNYRRNMRKKSTVMDFNEYQKKANSTLIVNDNESWLLVFSRLVLGLCGESGEVAEKVKKIIRDKEGKLTPQDIVDIKKELGDILWYISAVAYVCDIPLEEIAKNNINKLFSRKKRGKLKGSGDSR